MQYHKLGKTGIDVSAMGLGCWNFGNQWGSMQDKDAEKIIRTSFENGVTLFDVADNYGQPNGTSELRLGKYIKDIRDQITIVSKIGHWGERSGQSVPYTTPDMIRLCGHASLGRLQTTHLDVELCHVMEIEDPSVFIEGFRILKQEGFIREYGISTDSLEVLKRFYEMSDGECSVVEIEYSIANIAPERELLEYCKEKNLGVLVRGPLGQGIVSGKYDLDTVFTDLVRCHYNKGGKWRSKYEYQIAIMDALKKEFGKDTNFIKMALSYVISHEIHPVAIPGATSVEQAMRNAHVGDAYLTDSELEHIRGIVHSIIKEDFHA